MEKYNIKGKVKLFGCPAEEGTIGKVYMARAGVFDGLDACFTWHPGTENKVVLLSSLAKNEFEVIFRGKSAHAASKPWRGRSALDAVELMNIGVNFLREHLEDQVRIHYVITNGGQVPNVVPNYASVWYYVRDVNRRGVEKIYRRVLKCAEGAALMTETTMEVNLITGVYEYLPNYVLSEVLDRNFRLVGPPKFSEADQIFAKEIQRNLKISYNGLSTVIKKLERPDKSSSCSTDVADVSWIVPTSGILTVATAPLGISGHSWAMTTSAGSPIGFKGMIVAAKVLAAGSIDVLIDQDIIKKAYNEFIKKTKGFAYKSAVPLDLKPPVPEDK
jgi:aminobenzoyl-glutamate utilization protein B